MSQENTIGTVPASFYAAGVITRNALVTLNASGQILVTSAITDKVLGVAQQDAAIGEQCPVMMASGTLVSMKATAAIAAGAELMPAAAGAGGVATVSGATAISCGQAITAAAALGDVIMAVFRPMLRSPVNV